ncbi:hypothetical protein L6452_32685 [Arctium lappa]|uniref:Uncharacterized protein n=1 Tax=Arctium lappa TaxID=4217 RepID=A0ACB8Z660_ARCLA|nr:hypothetical protein L6452_32685 [Arctium lappa]
MAKDERLLFGEDEKSKLNFAAAVGNKESPTLQFFPLADKVQSPIHISVLLAKEANKEHDAMVMMEGTGVKSWPEPPSLSTPVRELAPTAAAVVNNIRIAQKPLKGFLKTSNRFNVLEEGRCEWLK